MNLRFIPLFVLTSSWAFAATPVIPTRLPLERYAKLKSDPPFSLATAEVAVDKPIDPPWSEGLYIGGAAIDSGVEWITVRSQKDPGTFFQLSGNEPGAQGIQLVKLEWSPEPAKVKAVVKKGDEFFTLEADKAAYISPTQGGGANHTPMGNPPRGIPLPNGAGVRSLPNTTPPRGGAAIPRPSTIVPPPTNRPQGTAGAPAPGTGTETRKRIRVINQ